MSWEVSLGSHLLWRYANQSLMNLSLDCTCFDLNTKLSQNQLTNLFVTQPLRLLQLTVVSCCCLYTHSFFNHLCCMIQSPASAQQLQMSSEFSLLSAQIQCMERRELTYIFV
jgi:hypothetical protein